MPQTDWYATWEDHLSFLDALFADLEIDIYELASAFEKPLRQITSPDDIARDLARVWPNGRTSGAAHYALHFTEDGMGFRPRRHSLNPGKCDGATWREAAQGWTLVRLDIGQSLDNILHGSCLFHATVPRMVSEGVPEDAARAVARRASRLTKIISREGVARLGRHAWVLPGAAELWDRGVTLDPFKPREHADSFVRV